VFPVIAPDREQLVTDLRRHGLDASRATSSIDAVSAPGDRPDLVPTEAERLMAGVIFLPVYPELPERALARLMDVLRAHSAGR
jgi:dTDP-4-amino-4,6-dideoxygalactose transaminase